MRTLEESLLNAAELELKMLASFMHDGSPDELANSYQRLSALTVFAYKVDSGLSDAGIAKLEELDIAAYEFIQKKPA